jgi:hypothetical protein
MVVVLQGKEWRKITGAVSLTSVLHTPRHIVPANCRCQLTATEIYYCPVAYEFSLLRWQ